MKFNFIGSLALAVLTFSFYSCSGKKLQVLPRNQGGPGGGQGEDPAVNLLVNGSHEPSAVAYGSTATVSWTSTNATDCYINGHTGVSDSYTTGQLTSSQSFAIECKGGGSKIAFDSVNLAILPPTATLTSGGSHSIEIHYGTPVSLAWSSTDAYLCQLEGFNVDIGGSWTSGNLTASTDYTLECFGADGRSDMDTVLVTVLPAGNPTVTLTVNGSHELSIPAGNKVTLDWTSTESDYCLLNKRILLETSGSWTTPQNLVDSQNYRIECFGPTGLIAADRVTINVPRSLQVKITNQATATEGISVCALKNGNLKCWGSNHSGKLGNNSTAELSRSPVQVQDMLTGVTAVSLGADHACAIKNGGLYCWGNNYHGCLGDGTTTNKSVPVAVSNMQSGVTEVAAGALVTCAIKDGAAYCWGNNAEGSLGSGDRDDRYTPNAVVGLTSGVRRIDLGTYGACAVHNDVAKCWGFGPDLLNDGQSYPHGIVTPTVVQGRSSGVTELSESATNGSMGIQDSLARFWGSDPSGWYPSGFILDQQGGHFMAEKIANGDTHSCALQGEKIFCWGDNTYGQLGNGTHDFSARAKITWPEATLVTMDAGQKTTCAFTAGSQLFCWGDNTYGQLNLPEATLHNEGPVLIPGI